MVGAMTEIDHSFHAGGRSRGARAESVLTLLLCRSSETEYAAYGATGSLQEGLSLPELPMDIVVLLITAALVALSLAFIRALERR